MSVKEIIWGKSLDLGYPLIDRHYRKLVSFINDFAILLNSPTGNYKKMLGRF